jgi:CRISPR/Cas system-associated exonuclease Cas4 (RecB family)
MNSEEEEIADKINEKFREGVRKWMDEEQAKRDKSIFHVSSFVYGCLRKVWYEEKYADKVPPVDDEGILRMWIGTKLHETPITEMHETPVWIDFPVKDFGGRLDEIFEIDGKKILVDKKFSNSLPKSMNDHYYKQITYYAAMLLYSKNILVDGVGIHYMKPTVNYNDKERERTFVKLLTKEEILEVGEEIKRMVYEVMEDLEKDILPPPYHSWYCQYCPFSVSCYAETKDYLADTGEVVE